MGIPKNKNTGFKLSKGDFITYLDGDDYYYPEKIESELNVFRRDDNLDVVYSNFNFVSENYEIIGVWKGQNDSIHEGSIFKEVMSRNFPKQTLFRFELMKAEVLGKINFYDDHIPAFHDWDSRIRYSAFANIGYADSIGSAYVSDKKGISHTTKTLDLLLEMRRVFLKNAHLLRNNLAMGESSLIKMEFLTKNRSQILKCNGIKKRPLLYARARLGFRNL